ncbi:hypothetical protein [Aequorivita lipolytica]|uniref:DUF5655 domain-containing protein n=1 Tax=Aequorivita lipolytica TaxID=153267 RepID=A0A5C6YKC8_9FLAO|nr:hypothetical protein [Aequorivita lipolytica]TXD67816.1 hypothetical protein ESV24_14995 [Aequorivita lipolytica]SRX54024.1 hypothetical protein AEQU2_03043 [Aequorivita lipolytica]
MNINLIRPEKVNLRDHPILTEVWLQDIIAKNPEIIGLGELILKDKERKQLRAGRLDILLQDPEINKRYEVEIQLGKTDESHIIRTIEYWDIERKRYPQYEHCAVIIAEEITSRFLNVIGLFNGTIPLIAIQLTAYKNGNDYFLTFNKVLDEMSFGLVDDDEEISEVTDRNYWETQKGIPKTVKIVDESLALIKEIFPGYELKYNKFYIGLAKDGRADNFILFRALKLFTRMEIRLEKDEELESKIEKSGIDLMDYDKRNRRYRLKITSNDLKNHKEFIQDLVKKAKGIQSDSEQQFVE